MSNQSATAETTKDPKPTDLVRCKVLHAVGLEVKHDSKGNVTGETTAAPGDIIQLPRKQAEQLAGRTFSGYPSQRQENGGITCGSMPMPLNGMVRDPIVQILSE